MESNEQKWTLGKLVLLPRTTKLFKASDYKSYERIIGSRYICIREATDNQYGILLKVLGRYPAEHIMMIDGEPFCRDDSMELFQGMCYFSYSFPRFEDLKEVLAILHNNPDLLSHFEDAKMHVNPKASFWVRETASKLFMKKPQCYDVSTDCLSTATGNAAPYRLTMVYFTKDQTVSVR